MFFEVNTNTNSNTCRISFSIPIPIPILGNLGFSIPIPIPILAKTPIPQYQYQVLSVSATGPTLFEVQAKWVLRVPTQFAFLSARNLSAAQLSSNQAFSFNISRLRKEMLTFKT